MKKIYFLIVLASVTGLIFLGRDMVKTDNTETDVENTPNDWFFLQRAFPYDQINYQARDMAYDQYRQMKANRQVERGEGWVEAGPVNIGGRISAVAMNPDNSQQIFAGAASGGVFRTNDQGTTWTPVLDDALSLSIGDIAIAPSQPSVVYVGTGEPNAGGGSITYDGYGIYRSDDSGDNWTYLGLENSGSIGRIAVDPDNPQRVFVAAMGRLFSKNEERGVFRSVDGGANWERILYVSDSTGAIDVVINPQNPDIIYACMWERIRTPDKRVYGGATSGIYRSEDGGDNWELLQGGLPQNTANTGRIGISISASDPDVLYTIYADDVGYFDGVYSTFDGGDNWTRANDGALSNVYSSYGWWFGRISIDPANPDVAYVIGYDLYKTTNGGSSWNLMSSAIHVDQHDIIQDPSNPDFTILGNDGGLYLSSDAGSSWTHIENLPITQFYTCDVDYQYPQRLYGGTQDNGTNRTVTGGINTWSSIYWGDGFYVLVDPTDHNYIYAEYQYGNFARSTNGGLTFSTAMNGISYSDRKNWCTPVVFDPSDPSILYYGSQMLYKTTNRASNWVAVSPDLTNGPGNYNQVYGTITTIAVAPSDGQYIYVGTDDANVWRTSDGGATWNSIKAGLPERWVTRVATDPYDANIVYVTLSGYRYDSYLPHIFRSTDAGDNWEDITGDLPEAPVNDIIADPDLDSTLYIATDFGVYLSYDLGGHWKLLGDNLPNVPILDMKLHDPTRKLVAASYGRSMFTFDLDQLVSVDDNSGKSSVIKLNVYPNPSSDGIFYIKYKPENKDAIIKLFNTSGQKIIEMKITDKNSIHKINLEAFEQGIYFLSLKDGGQCGNAEILLVK